MNIWQKAIFLVAIVILFAALIWPNTEYPSGYDQLVVNGVVVRNDVSISKKRMHYSHASKPGHRVDYASVIQDAITIFAAGGIAFLVAGALQARRVPKVQSHADNVH